MEHWKLKALIIIGAYFLLGRNLMSVYASSSEMTELEMCAAGIATEYEEKKIDVNSMSTQPMSTLTLTDGTYYMSNFMEGGYLYCAAPPIGRRTTIAASGKKIQWILNLQSNGYYTVREAEHGAFLECGNGTTPVLSYSGDVLTSGRAYWKITVTGSGCRIYSKNTGKYLKLNAIGSLSSANLSLTSTISDAIIWRVINVNQYGNSSAYTYRELSSYSTTVQTVNMGQSGKVTTTLVPSAKTLWTKSTDFSYLDQAIKTGYYYSINADGSYKAILPAYTKLKVIHKVTGLTKIINIPIKAKASLIGVVPSDSGERGSGILTGKEILEGAGKIPINYQYRDSFNVEEIANAMISSELFIFRGHGRYDHIVIGEDAAIYFICNNLPDLSEGSSKIVAYVACLTADPEKENTIAEMTNKRGATATIGFTDTIKRSKANLWAKEFIDSCQKGCTVQQSVVNAQQFSGINTAKIFGNAGYVWR